MGIGSFLAGLFLGSSCSSKEVHNYNTTVVHNLIQYPDDWDNYTDANKLEWLKNRSYWREYYQLEESLSRRVESKLVVESDDICSEVMNSIIRNEGDKTEAEQLFSDYLSKKYMFRCLNDATRINIEMETDRLNDYIRQNNYKIFLFNRSVEGHRFEVKLIF